MIGTRESSNPSRAPRLPLQVFFDGDCPLCAREIEHYRQLVCDERLIFIDISREDFMPGAHGRSLAEFMAQMHVRDAQGDWYRGVDAFPVIWSALPGRRYRWLGRFLGLPGCTFLARLAYRVFAANRHRLRG